MAANPKHPLRPYHTPAEYFALERTGDARYEYWDGEIVLMSGGSEAHVRISGNVYFALRRQLEAGRCEAFTGDLAVKTPSLPPYRYPDASVACGPAVFEKIEGMAVLVNPTLIVEVLSPATANRDRGDKRAAYQALPTVTEYLLIAQDAPHVTHFARNADGSWSRTDHGDLAATFALPSTGCELSLGDVYRGVDFS